MALEHIEWTRSSSRVEVIELLADFSLGISAAE
jgi:hypothetical protein